MVEDKELFKLVNKTTYMVIGSLPIMKCVRDEAACTGKYYSGTVIVFVLVQCGVRQVEGELWNPIPS